MNKTKKLAAISVSLVMAGSMAVAFTACGGGDDKKKPTFDETIKTMEYASGTQVRTSLGYNSTTTRIAFDSTTLPLDQANGSAAGTSVTLPDGKTYQKGALKPIWQSYENALNIKVSDKWNTSPVDGDTLKDCMTQGISGYDLIGAGNLTSIQTAISSGELLNLGNYLDYMPNLRYFLKNNALAELGTLSDASNGAIYYSPYYAGMNDAERYNMFRLDYVSELLDYADLSQAESKNGGTITFKAQADAKTKNKLGARQGSEQYVGASSSVTAYMGTTGSYTVPTTNPGDTLHTVTLKVDYDAANTAAKDENSPLGAAIKAAAGTKYSGTSGNIVDLQNHAINTKNGEVKGVDLLKILREYIKVAYKWDDNGTWKQFYGATVNGKQTKLGDLFNAGWGAWDVDVYAAIGRCFVTCGNLLGQYQAQGGDTNYTNNGASTWLFVPRTGYTNRTTRLTAMIGELYGVRGMEGNGYLDSSGTLRDHRFNVATWDALQKFSAFHSEGLVPSFNKDDAKQEIAEKGLNTSSGNSSYDGTATHYQGLSGNDFIHTQTTGTGLNYTKSKADGGMVETTDGYTWTGVTTPVSRWLTNDTSTVSATGSITPDFNGKLSERPAAKTTVTRFTESALKLKTGGLVVPKAVENDKNKLGATLALLDYIYSPDGQTVTTFGDISTKDNLTGSDAAGYTTDNDGWWYGEPVTSLTINGTVTDISNKSMADLADLGVVETHDNGKQYVMTKDYQGYALVYKNKLYRTGTNGANTEYPNGYVYNGVMTPYYTRAVRKLILDLKPVNGFKANEVMSSTNLQNLLLGAESHGIVNNASMVQLCNDMAIKGFEIFGTALGNGATGTVLQSISDNPWYTCAPSVNPTGTSKTIIDGYTEFGGKDSIFNTSSSISNYFILEVGWYGANASLNNWTVNNANRDISTPEKIVAYMNDIAPQYQSLRNDIWAELYDYYVNK